MAILCCRLATTLRSLAIILPMHLFNITRVHVCNCIPLITIRTHTRPNIGVRAHTLFSLLRNRIFFAHGIYEFYPLPTRKIIKSTIVITPFKTTYRSMITASTAINRCIIHLSTLMAAEKSLETNLRTRHITADDDNYHEYRPRQFTPANERNLVRSRY
jgi:hypothetical protein